MHLFTSILFCSRLQKTNLKAIIDRNMIKQMDGGSVYMQTPKLGYNSIVAYCMCFCVCV